MESVDLPLSDESHDVAMILRGTFYLHATGKDPEPLFQPLPIDET